LVADSARPAPRKNRMEVDFIDESARVDEVCVHMRG
jgi:hypothetical protein